MTFILCASYFFQKNGLIENITFPVKFKGYFPEFNCLQLSNTKK